MYLFESVDALKAHLHTQRGAGRHWGFVPTMGALHEGHLSLVRRSNAENDFTVASIYVNPTQFNNPDDLAKYPRTLDRDREMLEGAGCEVLFAPSNADMYPVPPRLRFDFGELESVMEGQFRPGHFNGVATVVTKLFHAVEPAVAYFGQKDLQQFVIISRLVQDLSFPLELVRCPIAREPDGLAMSSRNRRLEPEARKVAVLLSYALKEAEEALLKTKSAEVARSVIGQIFYPVEGVFLEYFEVVDAQSLRTVEELSDQQEVALCLAAYVGDVRLIDNVIISRAQWQ
jgi:pantoate--beta-alanine ligase